MRKTPLLLLVALTCAITMATTMAAARAAEDTRLHGNAELAANTPVADTTAAGTAATSPATGAVTTPSGAAGAIATPSLATAKVEQVASGGDKKEDKNRFPLSGSISLDSGWGEGFLGTYGTGSNVVIDAGARQLHFASARLQTQWSTSLRLGGSARLPIPEGVPKMSLSTGISILMPNWLPAASNNAVFERELIISDLSIGYSLPGLWKEDLTKISLSPSVGVRLPLSMGSRHRGLLTALTAGVGFAWSSDEADWGQISASYGPGFGFNIYSADSTLVDGVGTVAVGNNVPANPLANVAAIPIAYCRSAEALSATGECEQSGRQGIFSFSQHVGVDYHFLKNHSIGIGLGYSMGYIRPVKNEPALDGLYSSNQSFNESTTGSLSYDYDVPVDFASVSLGAAIFSGQSVFDANNNFNFPFFNFWYPETNASAASVNISVKL
ncbi:MAG TPA: hypothetical protein VGO62_00945 [Myxococcota bacterium]|jgi:hypothetical protein